MIFKSKPRITQYFGENPEYYSQWYLNGHEGLDLVPTGGNWTVFSILGGVARSVYTSGVYGITVIVHDQALGLSIRYAHLERTAVKEGERVVKGSTIGRMGNTPKGRSGIVGPMKAHLHINMIPMRVWGIKDYEDNGYKGRVDPLGILRFMGEL